MRLPQVLLGIVAIYLYVCLLLRALIWLYQCKEEDLAKMMGEANGLRQQEDDARSSAARGSAHAALTSTTLEAMRDVIREFFARVPNGRCSNCSAFSPMIKKQGHTKLFKVRANRASTFWAYIECMLA